MPRARRSDSSSSVETVDFSQTRWCQETSIIRGAPEGQHEDDYIIFEVENVTVSTKPGPNGSATEEEFPNVLEVGVKGPFTARGILVVEDDADQRGRVLQRRPKAVPMEVKTVHKFSIGETDTQKPILWFQGARGAWYELKPSAAYKPTYEVMTEGIFLYFRILDFYARPHERMKTPGNRDEIWRLFLQYASKVGDGSTYEDVAERCEAHSIFLFSQFENEKDYVLELRGGGERQIPWHTTEIYKWLKRMRNDALTAVQRASRRPPMLGREPPSRHQETSIAETASPAVSTSAGRRRERPVPARERAGNDSTDSDVQEIASNVVSQKATEETSSEDASSSDDAMDDVPVPVQDPKYVTTPAHPLHAADCEAVRTLIEAVENAYANLRANPITASSVCTHIYQKYKFPDMRNTSHIYKKAVSEVFHYYSRALIQDPAFKPFKDTLLHEWLRELAATPYQFDTLTADKFPYITMPRKRMERRAGATRSDSFSQPQEEVRPHPRVSGKRLPGRPRKSALSIATPRKRSHHEIGGDSDDDSEHKRSFYFSDGDSAMDDSSNVQDANAAAIEAEPTTVDFGEPVDFVLRAQPLPSYVSTRSDGAWVCDRNGCDYVVRSEAADVARERIKRHIAEHEPLKCDNEGCDFEVHEDEEEVARFRMRQHTAAEHGTWVCDREGCHFIARRQDGPEQERRYQQHVEEHREQDQKVNLAKSEGRPHLPIEHLLEKIRALGQRQDEAKAEAARAAAGEARQDRIKRKLLA